eukprot:176829-Rhodomonas_salina.1
MELHVDAFADEHNKRCERFWAQHPVFGSEVTDSRHAALLNSPAFILIPCMPRAASCRSGRVRSQT